MYHRHLLLAVDSYKMSVEVVKAEIKIFEGRFDAMKRSTLNCLEKFHVSVMAVVYTLTSLHPDYTAEYKEFLMQS